MDVDPGDMGTVLHFSAAAILGKGSAQLDIDQIAEKIRLMSDRDPTFSFQEISAGSWADRKARGAVWIRVYEAHRNCLALGR